MRKANGGARDDEPCGNDSAPSLRMRKFVLPFFGKIRNNELMHRSGRKKSF